VGREYGLLLNGPLALYYSFDIALAMQNTYDVKSILFQQIVNADEPRSRQPATSEGFEAEGCPNENVVR
jgi:hypothetical protein